MEQNKTILIAEDEQQLLNGLGDSCERLGLKVVRTSNGAIALEEALKAHPDMIILDLMMPIMDGISMLKKLREDQWGRTVPVLVWSNSRDPGRETSVRELGVDDFFVKSDLTFREFAKQIGEKLQKD